MKLSDKISSYTETQPFYTFEFFPPRTDQGFENLISRISRLSSLNPLAISVTWGAGGATKERSLELAGVTQAGYGLDTILHLTCTNMEQGTVDAALRAAKDRGIQSILALRGDPPRGEEYWIPVDPRFQHAIDLVSYIRSSPEFSEQFCIGVTAYPDGHTDGTASEEEIDHLKAKVDAGADFIVTQLFYDVDRFLQWVKKVRDKGITVPIIPGIMPIQTYSSFLRLTKLCGTHIPPSLSAELGPICHDDQKVKDYGVKLAVNMIQQLTTEGGIRGVHFCTLNLEKSVQRVLDSLQWTVASPTVPHNQLIDDINPSSPPTAGFIIAPTTAAAHASQNLTNVPHTTTQAGSGELNNASTWDEFPNGRFGDFKSPAFGNQGLWGGPVINRNDDQKQWGNPNTLDDLTQMFLQHLHSEITTTPFSPGPLSPESLKILPHLERMTKRGWWTVGSQPVADCVDSSDEVFGWGPRGGYVFQKGFVEFFAEKEDVEKIARRVEVDGKGWVHFFAGNFDGDLETNVPDSDRNAVTWGVFPGQEIAQTTIIERESFISWKDEAFSIWFEWSSFYHPDSPERKLLENVRDNRWLVSVVHHDYRDPEALWNFILGSDA